MPLLVYTLLRCSRRFASYVLRADVDVDELVLPVLEQLYAAPPAKTQKIYMLLVMLLMFSQDKNFCNRLSTLVAPELPWFKERVLKNVSLCDIAIMVLLRIVAINLKVVRVGRPVLASTPPPTDALSRTGLQPLLGVAGLSSFQSVAGQDEYVHQSSLGVVCNLSSHICNLHPYVCQRLLR